MHLIITSRGHEGILEYIRLKLQIESPIRAVNYQTRYRSTKSNDAIPYSD
jgi:hypothetical protein